MQSMKETAATIGASAKSGMEKTKATVQGTVEKMTTRDPLMKDAAEMKKQDRIVHAEMEKQQEINNAAAAHGASGTHSYSTTGETGKSTGMHQMSAVPGHGTGQPAGQIVEGVAHSHPIGINTGTQRGSAAQNTHVGGGNAGYGTGGTYT